MNSNRIKCFVVMPFSKTTSKHTEEYWTNHYLHFLKPLIEESGKFEASRSSALRGDIIKEIISSLVTSAIVVTELTDANSNVYWELGVRQSFKHGTITIAEFGTKLPFDIGGKGTLFYKPNNHLEMEEFRKQFKHALEDCILHPHRADSHVLETISGRGTIYELIRKDEAERRIVALQKECSFNIKKIDSIILQVNKNKDNPKERRFETGILRHSASELLMTTRYLDQPESFYSKVENVFSKCASINNQLLLWEHSPNATEKWLDGQKDSVVKAIESLNSMLKKVKTEIESRC